MENMSLDQYIKNNSNKSGGRARRFSNTDSPKSFQRRINIRSNLKNGSSPVKFTARLDTTSANGGGGGGGRSTNPIRRIPIKSHRATINTTTTTTSSSTSEAPPLRITIQNNTTTKKDVRERIPSRLDDINNNNNNNNNNNSLPRIRITKTVDRNSSLSRPIRSSVRIGGGGSINNSRNNGDVHISSRYSVDNGRINNQRRGSYDNDHSGGHGSSLFERRNSNDGGYNGPIGKSLQLFTGSRLNISNLHHGISEADLKVLFDSMGDIKQIKIHYDNSGRSDGSGYVIFSRHNDAMAALKKFNGAQLDGRTLKITTGPSLQEDVKKNYY
ncbi:hypothetical protein ACTFIU_007866 [Dictyostelium citrinum]